MALIWILLGFSMLFFSRWKKQNVYIYSFSLILVILLGFRSVDMLKNDTGGYYEWFGYDDDLLFAQFELFYAYLNKYVYAVGLPFEFITVLMAFITILFLILAFKKNNSNVLLSLALYYLLAYYFRSFNIMRQMVAASIILYAYSCLRQKENIKYFIFTLLASLIHFSSLLTLIAFFFRNEKTSFSKAFVFSSLVVTFTMGAINAFQPIISSYSYVFPRYLTVEATRVETFSFSKLAMNAFYIILCFNVNTKNLYMKLFFIGICLINIITFNVDMMRICYLFTIAEIMVLSDSITRCWKATNGNFASVMAITYSLFIFFYLVIWGDMSGVIEYDYTHTLHYK